MVYKYILVGPYGRTILSRVFQRPGRGGYYLGIAVPRELRNKLRKSEVIRKLGNTYKEANINKAKVEAEVQRSFGAELNHLSLVEKVTAIYENDPNFKGLKSIAEIPDSDKEDIRSNYPIELDEKGNPTTPNEAALWLALEGKTTYHQWINRRKSIENVSKSTVNGWNTKLLKLANWKGSDYLADLTKSEAVKFKDFLLASGYEPSSVKNIIGTLNAFWNWLDENDITKTNIWAGLKKRLPDPQKSPLPKREILDKATEKASTLSPWRKEKDYAFLIQRYTACRRGAANGLRHCDINLKEKTITFTPWEKIVSYKKTRGGKRSEKLIRKLKSIKDERTIPMSKALYEALKDMPIINGSDDPIWPNRYKENDDSWGSHHCSEYKNKYGLHSHDLRRFGITALINEGVSPYRIWDVVRHKIPGMSEVTMMYNRPTTQDLIEAMEVIAK